MATKVIKKQLAGKEDLLIGYGKQSQQRVTGFKDITKLNASFFDGMLALDIVPDMMDLDVSTIKTGAKVYVLGLAYKDDGKGGVFIWDETKDKQTHDGVKVIDPDKPFPTDWNDNADWFIPSNTGTGCWVKVVNQNEVSSIIGAFDSEPTQRPDGTALQVGDVYYNRTDGKWRVYDGSVWDNPDKESPIQVRGSFTGDGTTTTFNVVGGFNPAYGLVFLNGVEVTQDVDISDGQNIVFQTAPANGDIITYVFLSYFTPANAVDLNNNQTIYGTKTFNTSPVIPDAVNANEPLSKGQLLAEIQAIDGVGSGLDADLLDGLQSTEIGIGGSGYQWVDETANRAAGTVYTNTTGKPIAVHIDISSSAGTAVKILVDGVTEIWSSYHDVTNTRIGIGNVIVPIGSTYELVVTAGTPSINHWYELK